MKKIIPIAMLFLFLNQFYLADTYALSCVEMPPIEKAYEKYDAIIVGHVDKVIRHKDRNEVKITISRSFKGIKQDNIAVDENITWGALNGPSEVGEDYLFFLKSEEGRWSNPLCAPTMKIAEASEQLEFLQSKEIPMKRNTDQGEPPHDGNGPANDKTATGAVPANRTAIAVVIVCLAVGVAIYGFVRSRAGKQKK